MSALELDSLKREAGDTVSSGLSKLVGDLRYSARFKDGKKELKAFVFLEHQPSPDRFMAFRMLGYIHSVYQEMLPKLKKGERFPYPLAVVLHHGESPWKRIPPMRELIDMTPDVEDDILRLPIRLIDVVAMPVDELRGHPMVCALLDSLQSASMKTLPSRIAGILARLRGLLGKERLLVPWVAALTRYYVAVRGEARNARDELTHAYMGLYGEKEAGKMATTMLEQILREGKAEGEVKGQAKSVLMVLEFRFNEIPAILQRKLLNLRDSDRIAKMLKLAATCQSLKEFQKAL